MILQFLLNYFLTEYAGGELKPLYELFKKNNFDIKSILENLNPKDIMPLISTFIKAGNNKNNAPENIIFEGTDPIKNFADNEIVLALNSFLQSDN
jgi:hypothetical protein